MCIYTYTLKEENTQLPSCTHTYIHTYIHTYKKSVYIYAAAAGGQDNHWITGQPFMTVPLLDHWTTTINLKRLDGCREVTGTASAQTKREKRHSFCWMAAGR